MPSSKLTRSRVEAVPWAVLLRAAVILGGRWTALSGKDRARMTRLLRRSRGQLGNLSVRERKQLQRVVRKLDLKGARRELLALRRGGRRRRRRR